MDIWQRYCKRITKCQHCLEPIIAGTIMVTGKLWRIHGVPLKFTKTYYWHPVCWIEQGRISLEKIGYTRRKKLELTPEQLTRRNLILRKRATVKVRLKRAIEAGNLMTIDRLLEKMIKLKEEILPVGGIPKKWQVRE